MSMSDTAAQAERGLLVSNRSVRVDARPEGARLEATRAKARPEDTARREAPIAERPSSRKRGFAVRGLLPLAKGLATLVIALVAVLAAIAMWDDYVTAPWTRDGRVRVQVASVAPQISGQITELRIRDNQYVHKGDVLYVIDPFDFEVALRSDKAQLREKAADYQVKAIESERRQQLSSLATTPEEQQTYAGAAVQAKAAFDAAQQQVAQAEINLQRTKVLSPVNGYVTNLQMRVGDYAHEGTADVSIIDADSYWIDGNVEETKLAGICVSDRVEAKSSGIFSAHPWPCEQHNARHRRVGRRGRRARIAQCGPRLYLGAAGAAGPGPHRDRQRASRRPACLWHDRDGDRHEDRLRQGRLLAPAQDLRSEGATLRYVRGFTRPPRVLCSDKSRAHRDDVPSGSQGGVGPRSGPAQPRPRAEHNGVAEELLAFHRWFP
jgi:biotin carboxyl carrier protein